MITANTTDFTVTYDRAGHITAELWNGGDNPLKGVDFGQFSQEADVLLTWLEMDGPFREAMSPAINAYLHTEFAKR